MYSVESAKQYWAKRISENDGYNSVLYFSENEIINNYYDLWEKSIIGNELSKDLTGKHVLDIPVGIGRWTNDLLSRGAQVECVDISDEILKIARTNATNDDNNTANYTVAAIQDLSFSEATFSHILCTGLFEHLPEEQYLSAIDKFDFILSPGGDLFLVVNNKYNVFIHESSDNPYRKATQFDNGYFCSITDIDKVITKLNQNGFTIIFYATNPSFSLLRQICKGMIDSVIDELFEKALEKDLLYFNKLNDINKIMSDQIIIFARKKNAL